MSRNITVDLKFELALSGQQYSEHLCAVLKIKERRPGGKYKPLYENKFDVPYKSEETLLDKLDPVDNSVRHYISITTEGDIEVTYNWDRKAKRRVKKRRAKKIHWRTP